MEYLALATFIVSTLGILSLFAIKHWEVKEGKQLKAGLRESGDAYALMCKERMGHLREYAAKVPPIVIALSRFAIHKTALFTARFARSLEKYAHKLADLASHRHHFERTETRSDFLRRVSESARSGSASK